MGDEEIKGSSKKIKWIAGGLIAAALIAAVFFLDVGQYMRAVLQWIRDLGPWGPAIFISVYIVFTVVLIPGSLLTLGAGALFGLLWGTVYVSVGATLGATAAFLVGRYVARDWVAQKIEDSPRFKDIDQGVAEEGWKIVLLTRLSPVFPFTLLNYAFGLTRVKLKEYFLASWIGMIPGTVMYVYIGTLARSLAALGKEGRERTTGEWVLYGVGLLATIAVTVQITRIARKALKKRLRRDPENDSSKP